MKNDRIDDASAISQLVQAGASGDIVTLRTLLEAGMHPDSREEEWYDTALKAAARGGHLEAAKILLARGAETDFRVHEENTALLEASVEGHWNVVKVLVEHGANPLLRDDFGDRTGVWFAASRGQREIVDLMLETSLNPETRFQMYGELLLGASFGGHLDWMALALENGVEVNCRGSLGETPLMEAGRSGNADAVRFLLAADAYVRTEDDSGNTALNLAARVGSSAAVQALIDAGADIHHRNKVCSDRHYEIVNEVRVLHERRYGYSVLECACQSSNPEVVAQLLDAGLDVNERGWQGQTPLMGVQSTAVAKLLLERGADVDARDPTEWTALFHATFWAGRTEVMRLLLDYGADVNAVDHAMSTPLMWAFESDIISLHERHFRDHLESPRVHHPVLMETVKLLVESGADIHRMDDKGRTAVHYAFRYHYLDAVEFLLDRGARLDVPEGYLEEIRSAAKEAGRELLCRMLDDLAGPTD